MESLDLQERPDGELEENGSELDQVFERLYDRIRRLAARIRNYSHPTLGATALAHEAYMKLRKHPQALGSKSYDEIIVVFANAMYQILKDASRRKQAQKRTAVEIVNNTNLPVEHVLTVLAGMEQLEREYPRQAQIVRCRFLLGMTTREASVALNLSPRTVERELQSAKERLSTLMGGGTH